MEKELLDLLIEEAAKSADITPEQASTCIRTAFKRIQVLTQFHGHLDLSPLGIEGLRARGTIS